MLDFHNIGKLVGRPSSRKPSSVHKSPVRLLEKSIAIDMATRTDINQNQTKSEEQGDVQLWGISLRQYPSAVQFIILCSLVFLFYLIYGYLQELIFRLEGFKPFGWYLTLMQFAYYTMFGLIERLSKHDRTRKIPLQAYWVLAFLTVATMGLSNTSLGYLNYPTQVIFKCCKLIPVLIGSILIQGKKYGALDFIACICMSLGLVFFTLADSQVSPTFSTYGVILITLALCADAVIGNVQEKTMKQYKSSNAEMVLYSYGIGFLYILVGEVVSGDIIPAFTFCSHYPLETYGYGFGFSVAGYLGVNVVLALLKHSGALVAVTVTTCRKAVTMILSFIFFNKPFTYQYVWSGLIVLLGIYLNIYSKNKVHWNAKIYSLVKHYFHQRHHPGRGAEHVV